MRNLFYSAFFLFSTFTFGQITFEKGYITDKNGDRKDVLIKNYEWKNNPAVIEYRINEVDTPIQINTSLLKEFYVGDQKYVVSKVKIDRSSNKLEDLSASKNFDNKEEVLPLKVISEGKIGLYAYYGNFLTRFFYKRENENTYHQLNYKEYMTDDSHTARNEEYKTQLKNEFADNEQFTAMDFQKLVYKENSLKNIFYQYNNLKEAVSVKKNNFHAYIKPGIGSSGYQIVSPNENKKETAAAFRAGIELEYVINFNKGKWALISELSFQSVNMKIDNYNRRNFQVKYSSFQIPLGIKYNMFINEKSKIYLAPSVFYDMILNKDNFIVDNIDFKAKSTTSFNFAVGYNYKTFGAEIKWGAIPNFTSGYYGTPHSIKLDSYNISLSYKLF